MSVNRPDNDKPAPVARRPSEPIIDDAVNRVRDGEQVAFETIVRRYERPLRAWLAVQAAPGIDVDDVAQRSFVTVYQKLDTYQLGTDFGAWLFTVARFQLKTETTRLRRVADYHTRYGMDLLAREQELRADEPPEQQLERLEHLRTCMDNMADHTRQFLTWRYDDCIQLDEMSERSGRSVTAIKKLLWKLRRQLHGCVKSRMIAEGASS